MASSSGSGSLEVVGFALHVVQIYANVFPTKLLGFDWGSLGLEGHVITCVITKIIYRLRGNVVDFCCPES
jgi:hypothetical protein